MRFVGPSFGGFVKLLTAGFTLLLAAGAAHAQHLEPGHWKVTTRPESGGMSTPPQEKLRCLGPADVADLGKTFSPEASAVNANCERTEYNLDTTGLTWRLQCRGQIDMDVAGKFVFESPTRYTAMIATKVTAMGQLLQTSTAVIEGERTGPCP